MKLKIKFDLGNEQFDCDTKQARAAEIARVVTEVAGKIERQPEETSGSVADVNGNVIGRWKIT